MKTLYTILLLLIFTSTAAFAQVSVGEEAPDFTLQVLGERDGITTSLTKINKKVVYIFFYGAGCPHCQSNGPVTETQIYQSFVNDTNFVALGLDTWDASANSNNSFRSITGITYPLLLRAKQTLVDYYGGTAFYDRSLVIGADRFIKYKGTNFVNTDFEAVKEVIATELAKLSTSSEEDEVFPTSITLDQNYPNPFNPSTTISYALDSPGEVTLQVFNVLGKQVASLVNGFQPSGELSVTWDASSAPSGVYIYRLRTGGEVLTKRMLLIK